MATMQEILHERDSRSKKHSTQHLLYSREGFNSHCSGELDDPAEMTVRLTDVKMEVLDLYKRTYLDTGKIRTECWSIEKR